MKNLTILFLILLSACSMFFPSPDLKKSKTYSLKFSEKNWTAIDAGDGDYSYVNENSKSIIVVNSFCKKDDSTSLKNLASHLFAGIDKLVIEEQTIDHLFQRESIQVLANGKVDGVTSFFNLQILKKNFCTYDFFLISNSVENRNNDSHALDKLITGVKIE